MTRQATDQLYIELDYYYPEEYYVYTAEAVATVLSEASITCNAVKTVEAVITQISLFTPSFTINVTSSASTDLTATVSMSTTADKFKGTNVTLSTIVNLSLQADKLKRATATISSAFTQTASAVEYESYIATSPTPMYALGQALISTTQTHFGTHSLYIPDEFAGAESAITHTKFNIGKDDDFSIAFWYYPTANSVGTFDDIVSWYDGNSGWFVQRTSPRGIRFFIDDGTNVETDQTGTGDITNNDWNWIVITRTGDTLKIFVDGVEKASDTTHDVGSGGGSNYLRIGNITVNGSAIGYIDGLHITIGGTISTSVPTTDTQYATANTKLLMNWNDSSFGNWWDSSLNDLITAAASLSATATQSASASRFRNVAASLSVTNSISAIVSVVIEASASMTATSSVAASVTKITGFNSQLASNFNLTATVEDLDLAQADLAASFNITTTATVTKSTSVNLTSQATHLVTASRTRSTNIALNCQGFLVAAGLDLDLANAALSAAFTVSVTAVKTANAVSTQTGIFSTFAQSLRIKSLASAVSSSFTQTCSETRLKDVFISGTIGQVYFRNTVSSPNYTADQGEKFIRVGSVSLPNSQMRQRWAVSFWVSGEGYVWSSGLDDDTNGRQWILFNDDEIEFQNTYFFSGTVRLRWSTQDTRALHHYLFYSNNTPGPTSNSITLWVDGVEQSAPTVVSGTLDGYTTGVFDNNLRGLALDGSRWATFDDRIQGARSYVGALGQYVFWRDTSPTSNAVPAFENSSERQKLYNNGYVDIGSDGTATGLVRAWDYLKLENYTDLNNRGNSGQGAGGWCEVGDTFVVSQETFRDILSYTATEQDDVGPFAAVSTVSIAPISVFITSAGLTSTATVSAAVTKLVGIIENLSTTATLTAVNDRFRLAAADLEVFGGEVAVVVKTGRTLVTLESEAALSAQSIITASASAALTATASLGCQAVKTTESVITVASVTSLTAVNIRTRAFASIQSSTFVQSTAAVKTARLSSNPSANFVVYASPFTTWEGAADFNSSSSVTALAIVEYIAASIMTVSTTISCAITKTTRITANLQAFDFLLAIGTKVTLDPYYQLIVPRELSVKRIRQETGILTVDTENRVNTILAENMIIIVPSETSTWHIPYSPQVGARRVQ